MLQIGQASLDEFGASHSEARVILLAICAFKEGDVANFGPHRHLRVINVLRNHAYPLEDIADGVSQASE